MLLSFSTPQPPPPQIFPSKIKTKTKPYSLFHSLLSQPLTLSQTKSIHAQLFKHNLHLNVNLTLLLSSLYPSSFSSTLLSPLLHYTPNLLTFNLLIKSFSSTNPSLSLHLFSQMLSSNIHPDKFTLPSIINVCASLDSLPLVHSVHASAFKSSLSHDPFVVSSLINGYLKCGQIGFPLQVLDEFPDPDLATYNSAISGLAKRGQFELALQVFARMRLADLEPNSVTVSSVVTACGRLVEKNVGRVIHGHVVKVGGEVRDDVFVNSSLVFMYSRFGLLDSAELVFRSMPDHNVVSYNAMMSAYAQGHNRKEAWDLFSKMLVEGFYASEVTVTSMVGASHEMRQGRMIHGLVIKACLVENEIIGAALIDMYVRVKSLVDAQKLFDEIPRTEMGSWNSLILGYSRNGQPREALNLFYRLRDHTDLRPNSITLVGALRACGALGVVKEGKDIHDYIVNTWGIKVDLIVNTSLIDMYCKCRCMKTAREIFEGMRDKDLVAWRVMIYGYVVNGRIQEAMELFDIMRRVNNLKLEM